MPLRKPINNPELRNKLKSFYEEFSKKSWLETRCKPITRVSFNEAIKLAGIVPTDLIDPRFKPTQNGELSLEWMNLKGSRFSLILMSKTLFYLGIVDGQVMNGKMNLLEEKIPKSLVNYMKEHFSKEECTEQSSD